jgi:hypothetical protein
MSKINHVQYTVKLSGYQGVPLCNPNLDSKGCRICRRRTKVDA